jgi:hypothetical protein
MLRFFLLLLLLVIGIPTVLGQANLRCQVRPSSLAAMRHCYRPLLVFSPSAGDARLKDQSRMLDAAADDMMDRFVMFTPVLPDTKGFIAPLDTPYIVLTGREMRVIREQFHVPANVFEVLLLNEEGRAKLRSEKPVDVTRLNALIDSMPEREVEMLRRDAN